MRLSLTVCVPARNEANNIQALITHLLNQTEDVFQLAKILVYSDASTDGTANLVRALGNTRVEVLEGQKRVGKAGALNILFKKCTTDFAVAIDADAVIESRTVLEELLSDAAKSGAALATGSSRPLPPATVMQRLQLFGTELWRDIIKHTPGSEMYTSGGVLAAFRKDLYTRIQYPATSADDVYPFLYAMQHGFAYVHSSAEVRYKLPTTYGDYLKQYTRFLRADSASAQVFPKELLQRYYVIKIRHKLFGLARALLRSPLWALIYIAALIPPKLMVLFSHREASSLWDMVESTKIIN